MPTEPPPTPWALPDPRRAPDDLVGCGGDMEAGTLLAAYRTGLFPMTVPELPAQPGWWSPLKRGVLPLDRLVVSRSLRASAKRFEIRVDTAFQEVVRACADPSRPHGWIDAPTRAAYVELNRLGWAHSIEAWSDGELAGGLYGVAIGGLFAGESMFHRHTDASKVALVALVDILSDWHATERLLDVQWLTPHLASLGATEIPRRRYLSQLERALEAPLPKRWA